MPGLATVSNRNTGVVATMAAAAVVSIYWYNRHQRTRCCSTTIIVPCYRVPISLWRAVIAMAGDNVAGQLLEWRRAQLNKTTASDTVAANNVLWVPLPLWGGGLYIIGDAQLQREILLDPTTEKDDMYDSFAKVTSGLSVFSRRTADPHWKVLRKGAAPAFATAPMERMHTICRRHVEEWISTRLSSEEGVTVIIDPSYELTRLTMRIILDGSFEYTVTTDEEANEFLYELNLAMQEFVVLQSTNPLRGLYGQYVHAATRRAHVAADRLRAFARKVLESYRRKRQENEAVLSTESTLIRLIETNPRLSEDDKLSEIVTYIVAGHDTTGYTLANTLFLIAQHSSVMEKVATAQTDPNTLAPYTQWCLWESFRLEPVVATGVPRITGRDFFRDTHCSTSEQRQSLRIPAHRTVLIAPLLCHRDPAVFAQPDAYLPERWESISSSEQSRLLHTFLLGKRNCIGQSLAKTELQVVLARVLSDYTVQVQDLGAMREVLTWHHHGGSLRFTRRRRR